MDLPQDLPIHEFDSQQAWDHWLEAHHATSRGLWLKIAKKDAGIASVSYQEALESALCYGWIDGQKRPCDGQFWLQRFTPRGRRSKWSRVNRDKALELIRQGRMKPAGQAQVEQAQRDGRWDAAYEPPSVLAQRPASMPDDLQRALDEHPVARAFFATLNSRNRYAILYRLQDAKRPETRARRLEQFVAMLDEGKKPYP